MQTTHAVAAAVVGLRRTNARLALLLPPSGHLARRAIRAAAACLVWRPAGETVLALSTRSIGHGERGKIDSKIGCKLPLALLARLALRPEPRHLLHTAYPLPDPTAQSETSNL